ncbi:MAG: type II/IV secretion system protein, partial [bacterium]|nr:type II/IV secretion system protein [bacterium]
MKVSPKERSKRHALEIISEHRLISIKPPHGVLTLERLTLWLAKRSGLDYLRIDPLKIDVASIGDLITVGYAAWNSILPVSLTDDRVVIATSEPYLTSWIDELRGVLHREIDRVVANPRDIERYRSEFFGVSSSVKGASAKGTDGHAPDLQNLEALVELGKDGHLNANHRHIVHIVDWLLKYALDQRASDIHIEPRREVGNIRFRIDGVMHQVYQIPRLVMLAVTSRIKILGRMDVAEKRRPQDGRIKTRAEEGREVEMRLSTMPTAFGEKLVLRIFDPDVLLRSFNELGFDEAEERLWRSMVSRPNGIILLTGPTGSGKTTTLYSTLKHLARPQVNVCSVEDPIEMVEPTFNQMQVQTNIGLDFASGIRTLMRQDPDIIMIGEIRDRETADMAVQAALTGHLVLSSLHTNDSLSAIARLLDIGVPHYLISATLIGVVAQRLVRTLCSHCKRREAVDANLWRSLVAPWKLQPPADIYIPSGCLECRKTGYYGRAGLYEILNLTGNLKELITHEYDE